jgi:tetratricopeptide (TPR) repeat protein
MLLAILLSAFGCADSDQLVEIRSIQAEGRVAETLEPLTKLVESGDRRPEVLYRYAQALLAVGENGRAVWALDAVIGEAEYTVPAARALAFLEVSSGNHDQALRTLDRLKQMRTDGGAETDVAALLLEARAYLDTRRSYAEALDVIEHILDLEPDNPDALRYRVAALLGDRQPEEAYEAIQELSEAAVGDPDSAGELQAREAYWCAVAVSFHRDEGELDEAEEIARECVDRFPNNSETLANALEILGLQGKAQDALDLLRSAYDHDPSNRGVRTRLVSQLRAMHRFDDAEEVLTRAIEVERERTPVRPVVLGTLITDLGRFLIQRDRIEEGLEAYDEVMALIGEAASPDFLFGRAEALLRVGRFDEALQIAKATTVEVHRPMIRGRVAFEKGDYGEALRELDEAARVWPNNAPIRYYLARSYEAVGDFDQATEEYRQALRSDRSLAAPRIRLARLHLAENRVIQAASIMMIGSEQQNAVESLDAKRAMIVIQARMGQPIDLSLFPNDPKWSEEEIHAATIRTLGEALRARDTIDASIDALSRLYERAPDSFAPLLMIELVESLVAADQPTEAARRAREALASRGEHPQLRLALARALTETENAVEEAEQILSQATERDGSALAHLWLGELAAEDGRTEEAIRHYSAAVGHPGLESEAVVGLARALVVAGDAEQASTRLNAHLLEVDPYDGEAALELARVSDRLGVPKGQQIRLAARALRFGGGKAAADLLRTLDPLRFPAEARADTVPSD